MTHREFMENAQNWGICDIVEFLREEDDQATCGEFLERGEFDEWVEDQVRERLCVEGWAEIHAFLDNCHYWGEGHDWYVLDDTGDILAVYDEDDDTSGLISEIEDAYIRYGYFDEDEDDDEVVEEDNGSEEISDEDDDTLDMDIESLFNENYSGFLVSDEDVDDEDDDEEDDEIQAEESKEKNKSDEEFDMELLEMLNNSLKFGC